MDDVMGAGVKMLAMCRVDDNEVGCRLEHLVSLRIVEFCLQMSLVLSYDQYLT